MRQFTLVALGLAALAAVAGAQPTHGDLILTVGQNKFTTGYTAVVSPVSPTTLTTIAIAPAGRFHNWVRMAPDNRSFVVSESHSLWTPCDLIQLTPGGSRTTIVRNLDEVSGLELDHDGHWIACTGNPNTAPKRNLVVRIAHAGGAVSTLASFPSSTMAFNEVAIDRDPGSPVYVVACWEPSTLLAPKILGVDGGGKLSTIVRGAGEPLGQLTGIELHPRSGSYVTTDFLGPAKAGGMEVNLVSKSGSVSTLATLSRATGAKINQDDTAWITGHKSSLQQCYLMHYDLATRTVLSVSTLQLGPSVVFTGVEVYGSRTLVCHQPPARTPVAVTVQSQLSPAHGKPYALAASFARRPGVKLPNGEWLDLNVTDPLFFLSALGALPTVFEGFQGELGPYGKAIAKVNIPSSVPLNLGITVFVAGVIFDPKRGVIQVTNTHWFVL